MSDLYLFDILSYMFQTTLMDLIVFIMFLAQKYQLIFTLILSCLVLHKSFVEQELIRV